MKSFGMDKRRAIANLHIQACADTLTNPNVAKALGDYSDRLIQILEWLYVPNMRDGVYEAPRRFRDSPRIPLVIVGPGEEVAYRTDNLLSMHPEQRSNLKSALEFYDRYDESMDIDGMVEVVTQSALKKAGEVKTLEGSYLDTAMARVHPEYGKLHLPDLDNDYMWVATRPMIVMSAIALLDEGTVLAHENVHVDQFLDDTLIYDSQNNETTRVELEPNHIEYEMLKAKYGGHVPLRYWYIERKEKVRILANGTTEEAFQATPKLLEVMARYGYDETFGRIPRQSKKIPIHTASKKKNKHGRVGVKRR
jgi:hypothetical protein